MKKFRLRIVSSEEEKMEEELDLEKFVTEMRREKGKLDIENFVQRIKGAEEVGLGKICPTNMEKKRRVSQKTSEESRPSSGKENYGRVDFGD